MSNQKSDSPALMHGVYVALATPRKPNSVEADASALLDYIDTIVRAEVDGLVLFGSTGEFVHYDIAERVRLLSLANKRSRVPLAVNVSHSSFAAAVSLAENAIEAGAAAILLMPPYFFHYSDNQLFSFYENFVKVVNSPTPIYLYNIPFFTNPMSASLMQRLLSTGAFAGIKDSSGEWPLFEAIQSVRDKVQIQNIVGNDGMYARARLAGADGIVSGVAAAVPELMVALDRALLAKNTAQIEKFDSYLQEFLKYLHHFPATIAIKEAAVVRGWKQEHSAIPFDSGTLAEITEYRRWFEQWLPTVLAASSAQ
jgi:dihydrodipicolinate synthase/N-acetylneuraminate lyase